VGQVENLDAVDVQDDHAGLNAVATPEAERLHGQDQDAIAVACQSDTSVHPSRE
jgi:Asp/Glu/hydantoin racemase